MAAADADAVLVIGGSDSSGGAGIARDLRTLADFGVRGVAVVTAVTAQTHADVVGIHPVPARMVRDQIATALASNRVRAVKIGMLATAQIVAAVAASLPPAGAPLPVAPPLGALPPGTPLPVAPPPAALLPGPPAAGVLPVVLDPVLAASSGRALLDEEGRRAMLGELFARATLVTPNLPEAARLIGADVAADTPAAIEQARRLMMLGARAVLLKGGHAHGEEVVDLLVTDDTQIVALRGPRFSGSVRGTGCALASAIAAGLARDRPLLAACEDAHRYIASLFALDPR